MQKLYIMASLCLLGACQSQIMAEYVGKDLREVRLQNGPPTYEMDMGDGIYAFQWERVEQYTSSEVIKEDTTYKTNASGDRIIGSERTVTTITPSKTYITNCLDTYFARKEGSRWIITGFQQPSFACE